MEERHRALTNHLLSCHLSARWSELAACEMDLRHLALGELAIPLTARGAPARQLLGTFRFDLARPAPAGQLSWIPADGAYHAITVCYRTEEFWAAGSEPKLPLRSDTLEPARPQVPA